jgi:YesN/AraC family two-component response regulator
MENFTGSTLLIVDDEAFLLQVLKARLKQFGANILTAENGKVALDLLSQNKVDAVLTDIDMPVMDGLALLARMRELGMMTPVVVLTGVGDQAHTLTALRLGATDLLDKPFDSQVILEVVGKALRIGVATRQLEQASESGVSSDQIRKWKEALTPSASTIEKAKTASRKK